LDIMELWVGAGRSGSVMTPVDHTTRPPTTRLRRRTGLWRSRRRHRPSPPPPILDVHLRFPPSPSPSHHPSPHFPLWLTPFIFLLDLRWFEEAARSNGGHSVHHPRRPPFLPASLLISLPRRSPSQTSTTGGASSSRKVHLLELPSNPPQSLPEKIDATDKRGWRFEEEFACVLLEHRNHLGLEMAMGTRHPKSGGFLLY
jgi:hypothetical protein